MRENWFTMGRGERLVLLLITLLLVSLCFMLLMPSGKTGTAGLMAAPTDTLTDFQKNLKPVAVTPEKHPELHTKQRKDTIITDEHYVGPPVHLKTSSVQKLKSGSMVDINTADSVLLTRVPGIGAAFARRIVRLRERLGGFYTVMQLQEVYGMDYDRYLAVKPYFRVSTGPVRYPLCELNADELPEHPYLSWAQRDAIKKVIRREGRIRSWQRLMRLDEFTREDSIRLSPYFTEIPKDTIHRL